MADNSQTLVPSVGRNGQIISNSGFFQSLDWPEQDPTLITCHTRTVADRDVSRLRSLADPSRFNLTRFQRQYRSQPVEIQLFEFLNHRAFQFNSRECFRSSDIWWNRLRRAVTQCRPIPIILPVFCVIDNPIKRLQTTTATAADDVSLLHLESFAAAARAIYEPGIEIHLVSDSTFYSPAFGTTSVAARHYIMSISERISALELSSINLHDMSDILATDASAFYERFLYWCSELNRDPLLDQVSPIEYRRWLHSMFASINIRVFDLTYNELRCLFGPSETAIQHPAYPELLSRAQRALAEYRAVKLAAADLDWEERLCPGAIRATIHTKSVPVLGLRLYPEYKFSSTLLPYHGIGYIVRGRRGDRMIIAPELLILNKNVTRVTDTCGTTLYYEEYSNA